MCSKTLCFFMLFLMKVYCKTMANLLISRCTCWPCLELGMDATQSSLKVCKSGSSGVLWKKPLPRFPCRFRATMAAAPTTSCLDYMKMHQLDDLFKDLLYSVLYHQPPSPIDFLIGALRRIQDEQLAKKSSLVSFSNVIERYALTRAVSPRLAVRTNGFSSHVGTSSPLASTPKPTVIRASTLLTPASMSFLLFFFK